MKQDILQELIHGKYIFGFQKSGNPPFSKIGLIFSVAVFTE